MMTNSNIQPALPFVLPTFGNSSTMNAQFVANAGAYLFPMRNTTYQIVAAHGGVPVHTDTRFHNVEFMVADGQHFMHIMKQLGIHVTHMENAPGGYKAYRNGDLSRSVCFVQRKTVRGQVSYKAVMPMRSVAHELFALTGIAAPMQAPPVQQDPFISGAMSQVDPEPEAAPYAHDLAEYPEDYHIPASELPFPEVNITEDSLPGCMQ